MFDNFAATWGFIYSGVGIIAGAHRLWTHKSYKAKWPLKLYLMILDTLAFQVIIKFEEKRKN